MEAQSILTAPVLDILFEGRNKAYGAYTLRKEYNRRLATALIITISFITGISFYFYFQPSKHLIERKIIPDIILDPGPVMEKPKIDPPRPPSKPPAQVKVQTIRNTTPVIVRDAPEEDMPPENNALENAKTGSQNQDGPADDAITATAGASNGINGIEGEKDEGDENKIFETVQIASAYPGGPAAWKRFLLKTVRYPSDAEDNRIEGTVIVQFVVDTDGNVSDVEAVSGPEELKNEAVRVIKRSGAWTAAIQNGRKVKSYKKQPITFRLGIE